MAKTRIVYENALPLGTLRGDELLLLIVPTHTLVTVQIVPSLVPSAYAVIVISPASSVACSTSRHRPW